MTAELPEDDQPEDEEITFTLVFPFVVCQSNGGPFDDDAFAAGYAMGRLDECLRAAQQVGAQTVAYSIRTELIAQAELMAMHYGFPKMVTKVHEEYPEWCEVSFARSEASVCGL